MSIVYHTTVEPGLQEGQSGPGPWDQLTQQENPPSPPDAVVPYDRTNGLALPVNQRSPLNWTGQTYIVTGKAGKATHLLVNQKGRKGFLITVPNLASSPAGIYVDSTAETLIAPGVQGFYVPVGGAFGIDSEMDLWAISATPGTDTQVCIAVNWG